MENQRPPPGTAPEGGVGTRWCHPTGRLVQGLAQRQLQLNTELCILGSSLAGSDTHSRHDRNMCQVARGDDSCRSTYSRIPPCREYCSSCGVSLRTGAVNCALGPSGRVGSTTSSLPRG